MEKEEAMKILRELHDKTLFSERTALETFIPELKESEDEKVRKTLVELVKCNERSGHFLINNVTTSSMISWLEKQGEQKPTDKDMVEALRTEYEKGRADVIADTLSWLENCWPRYCSNQTIIKGFKEAIKGE